MRPEDRHWWNRRWGDRGRRDIWLRHRADHLLVEARAGGPKGTARSWELEAEDDAYRLVNDLLGDGGDWCELTVRP